jgi:hypothetical protein
VVSFKNTLIIMTSNLGSAEIFTPEGQQETDRGSIKDKVWGGWLWSRGVWGFAMCRDLHA